MPYEYLKVEVEDYVATVTLSRAPVNALNYDMRQEIITVFDSMSDDPKVRCVVLTSDQRVFCAGADLKDRPSTDELGTFWAHNRAVRETGNAIKECAKPVIAAVNGAALGAGFGLVAACDIIYATEESVLGMPEIDVGLAGGAAMLREFFSRSRMRRMFFTGWRVPAPELYRIGMIEGALPADELMSEVMKLAREIASKSPDGIRYAKMSANMVENMPQRDAYRMEQNFTVALSRTENAQEARRAFVEKRKPVFKDV